MTYREKIIESMEKSMGDDEALEEWLLKMVKELCSAGFTNNQANAILAAIARILAEYDKIKKRAEG